MTAATAWTRCPAPSRTAGAAACSIPPKPGRAPGSPQFSARPAPGHTPASDRIRLTTYCLGVAGSSAGGLSPLTKAVSCRYWAMACTKGCGV